MKNQRIQDEAILIDYLRGELPAEQVTHVEKRLADEPDLVSLHKDLRNAFDALKLCPESEPPEHLAAATMARIDRVRRTEALLAREEARRGPGGPVFSLRELAAVAAAVLLMAVIFVPSIREARRQAVIRTCGANVGYVGSAMLTYANANQGALPHADGSLERWLPVGDQHAFSNSAALFKLVQFGLVRPTIFQCPAGRESSFAVRAGMTDFPEAKFIGYSYQHPDFPNRLQGLGDTQTKEMVILADSTPLFANGRFRREKLTRAVSDNHHGRGQNVLYLDMHVRWAPHATVGIGGDNIFLVDGVVDYRGDERPAGPTDSFLLPAFSRRR